MLNRFAVRILWLVLGILVLIPISAAQDNDDLIAHTLNYADLERNYYIHLPKNAAPTAPAPLVIALHGFASSAKALQAISGLDATADSYGYMVAYPKSVGYGWNDGRPNSERLDFETYTDDIGFIQAMIEQIAVDYTVDTTQVHLIGFNNGGGLAFRAACEIPQTFASVNIVSALMWNYQESACATLEAHSIPIRIIHGSNDPFFPINSRSIDGSSLATLGVDQTMNFWVERNNCDPDSIFRLPARSIVTFDSCAAGASVTYFGILGGSSQWAKIGAGYQLNLFNIDTAALLSGFIFNADNLSDLMAQDMAVNTLPRHLVGRGFTVYVPDSYTPETPLPLVVVLHGRPSNGTAMAYITDMNSKADAEGFIVVYPDGFDWQWNYVQGIIEYGSPSYDDVAFIQALVADLSLDLAIDSQRVYATGFSNGGFMTQRLACSAADTFAAFGVVGATAFYGVQALCEDTAPVPILFIHGTQDRSVPWAGMLGNLGLGTQAQFYAIAPIPETVAFWADHSGCNPDGEQVDIERNPASPADTQVRLARYTECEAGAEVWLYGVLNGGHAWVGLPNRISSEIEGGNTLDIVANDVIWDFFQNHTLAEREAQSN